MATDPNLIKNILIRTKFIIMLKGGVKKGCYQVKPKIMTIFLDSHYY